MPDHYTTLDITRNASQDDIKKAYRKLASLHHPDKGGNTAKFQDLQTAYNILSDPAQRQKYDNPAPQFSGFNSNDRPDFLKQAFGFGRPQQPRRNHVRMVVSISLLDVANGGSRTVSVSTSAGTSTVQVGIPRGINDGDNVQYGGVAPGGMDLVVQYRIIPDPKWRRDGLDLHTEQQVNIWDLMLGTDLAVVTLTGDQLLINIPLGSQPNTVMRLKSRGLQDQNGQAGDLFVKLLAHVPSVIAPEITAAIRQYRN